MKTVKPVPALLGRSLIHFRTGAIALAVATACASTAMAADSSRAPADEGLTEVVVTGSRILRRDYEANSPIMTVDESFLKNSSTAGIETNLAKLPQFHAVQTPAQGGDIQPTATNTPGAATISLRGLGTNRNLILLDGRRATPGNASQVVDINTIPALAIERVETITGGASATYGADAVGGVVNFIMRDKFQGAQVDAQYGGTEHGGGAEYQVGGILGSNLADGRGNVMLAFSLNHRDAALHIDRPWFTALDKNPNVGLSENDIDYFPVFSGYDPQGNFPSQAVVTSLFPKGNGGVVANQVARYYFNTNGTPFTGFFQSFTPNGAGTTNFTGDTTGIRWAKTADGQLKQNFLGATAVLPLQRDNFLTRGSYDLNDYVTFFGQGMFSKVATQTEQAPAPSVNGWSVVVPYDTRAIPANLAAMLNSRVVDPLNPTTTGPTQPWQLVYNLGTVLGDRVAKVDVFTYNMQGGLKGRIPNSDWTWEAYASTGESETSSVTTGNADLERLRAVMTAPNWGKGFSAQGNAPFGGFGASSATCTSGLNPFDQNLVVSADCKNAIGTDLKTRASLRQDIEEVNAQGKLFTLPAGEVRAAIGATHRESKYEFLNDTLTTQGRSFLDQSVGIYPSGNSSGKITVKEIYAEALVPVLAGLPAVKKLELELGARKSDYNTTGGSTTWKAMANWEPNDFLRIRGGYNRAERSPNIAELFLAPQQTFTFNATGDLCSTKNTSALSANPANGAQGAAALALCKALMEKSFVGTATTFYNNPTNQTIGGTYAFPTLQGNTNVKPEIASTYTLGAVIASPFDSELLRTMRLSVDYYHIKVDQALGPQSIDVAQRQCFDPAFNPGLSINSPYCSGINRVAHDGALGNIITTFYNNGRFETSGVDTQFDWSFHAGPGKVSLNSVITYLISEKSAELSSDKLVDYVGTLGPNQNGLNPGAFRWKMYNTIGYQMGDWTASLQWQHQPSIASAEAATDPKTTIAGAGAYDLFGLGGTWAVRQDVSLRFGIDNLFDKAPPLVESNTAAPAGTLSGGFINDVLYDVNGRRYYVGVTAKF
jgi:iron complex outermembrane recepter protein